MMQKIITILIAIIIAGCDPRYGFIESKFKLSEKSRAPKWILSADKYNSKKYKILITIYSGPFGEKAKVCLADDNGNNLIKCKIGSHKWSEQTRNEFKINGSNSVYPNFTIITIDGIPEVFEQKELSDILYISDAQIH